MFLLFSTKIKINIDFSKFYRCQKTISKVSKLPIKVSKITSQKYQNYQSEISKLPSNYTIQYKHKKTLARLRTRPNVSNPSGFSTGVCCEEIVKTRLCWFPNNVNAVMLNMF